MCLAPGVISRYSIMPAKQVNCDRADEADAPRLLMPLVMI
jgi:hypothetical protein